MDSWLRPVAAMAFFGVLAGCASFKQETDEILGRGAGLMATLKGTGSAATGTVRVSDYRDGVSLQMTLYNVLPGTYRIALHERGNCTSPNLFSAGPAWAPPDSGKAPGDLLPEFSVDTGGDMKGYVASFKGGRVSGPQSLAGRSVVIHHGYTLSEALPGLPNNRMACGVLQPVQQRVF
ncbi:MAG: superoxide dismutase family protein [Burkholderiales bacterium]|nr:superoxide dismutase family protein [Burkholderiales bacterium]